MEQTKITLDATTQYHVRSAIIPLSRRYRVNRIFEPKRLLGDMVSDTMNSRYSSIHRDYKYCQVFGNREIFCEIYFIKNKTGASVDSVLKRFLKKYGVSEKIITDRSKKQISINSPFLATLRKNRITPEVTLPHRPNHNPCKIVIKELRKR